MQRIRKTASGSYISRGQLDQIMAVGFEHAVDRALDDHLLTEQEEAALSQLNCLLAVPYEIMDSKGALTRLVKCAVLRDVTQGIVPQRQQVGGLLPFNLMKSEELVWVFKDVDYFVEKTRTHYKGGSQGVSIRVMKGVYYRTGGFKGRRVQTQETVHADTGLMGVTTKHIYFAGSRERFRVRYSRIVSFDPYADGIGIMREAQSATPQSFRTGDGWFTHNLVANLARM